MIEETATPDTNPQTEADQPPFHFKGGLTPMTQMELLYYDYPSLNQRLARMTKQAPSFFKDMPVIINLERLKSTTDQNDVDFIELTEVCQAYGIYPIAIRGGTEDQVTAALVAGLPLIPANPTHKAFHQHIADAQHKPAEQTSVAPQPARAPAQNTSLPPEQAQKPAENPAPAQARIIHHAVRSGQQVYAPGGDLIILNTVSAGAEILADGNIHVYGTLRGRALAGVKGNTKARIFCQRLEAELLSIAGHYKMDDDLQRAHWKEAVQASLDGKRLKIEALGTSKK